MNVSKKCITPYCHSKNIVSRTGKPTRTPGFHPDYECLSCGARWIERIGGGLREFHEAAQEARARRDNAKFDGQVSGGGKI